MPHGRVATPAHPSGTDCHSPTTQTHQLTPVYYYQLQRHDHDYTAASTQVVGDSRVISEGDSQHTAADQPSVSVLQSTGSSEQKTHSRNQHTTYPHAAKRYFKWSTFACRPLLLFMIIPGLISLYGLGDWYIHRDTMRVLFLHAPRVTTWLRSIGVNCI